MLQHTCIFKVECPIEEQTSRHLESHVYFERTIPGSRVRCNGVLVRLGSKASLVLLILVQHADAAKDQNGCFKVRPDRRYALDEETMLPYWSL